MGFWCLLLCSACLGPFKPEEATRGGPQTKAPSCPHPAIKELPGLGIEGLRGWDRVCTPKRSAWPWAVGASGSLLLALSSAAQPKDQGCLQKSRGLPPSHPFTGGL